MVQLVGLAMLILTVAGCNKDSSSAGTSYPTGPATTPVVVPTNTILMAGMAFSPTTITVAKGTTITWKNDDGIAHTSTSDTGVWDTGNIPAGGSKTTVFATAGTFPFHCTYHSSMMRGTVTVQ
jgi:plastocyanin